MAVIVSFAASLRPEDVRKSVSLRDHTLKVDFAINPCMIGTGVGVPFHLSHAQIDCSILVSEMSRIPIASCILAVQFAHRKIDVIGRSRFEKTGI